MKLHRVIAVACLGLALAVPARARAETDPAETLRKAAEVCREQFGSGELADVLKRLDILQEAGLSYQPSLTVPLKGSQACKDSTQVQVVLGMLTFDTSYALVFGKKKEFFDTLQYMNTEISSRLKEDFLHSGGMVNASSRLVAEDFTKPENVEKYRDAFQKQFDLLVDKIAVRPEAMAWLLDRWYGVELEAWHLACSLSLHEKWGEVLSRLFAQRMRRLEKVDRSLQALKDSKYADLVRQPERSRLLGDIRNIYQKKKGQLDRSDIRAILDKVDTARAEFLKPCR